MTLTSSENAAGAAAASSECERSAWLSNVSELTSIVTHEFNNMLNGILLHAAVLKQGAGKEIADELEVIRKLGINAATLIKQLQQYNSKRRTPLEPVDVNAIVRETVAGFSSGAPFQLELAADLPRVQGNPREIRRLFDLLVQEALAAMAPNGGTITIRTGQESRRVLVRVEDTGPPIADAELPRVFEPFHVVRSGGDEAGLAICHTLARHQQGTLRAENLSPSGVAFIVELSSVKR